MGACHGAALRNAAADGAVGAGDAARGGVEVGGAATVDAELAAFGVGVLVRAEVADCPALVLALVEQLEDGVALVVGAGVFEAIGEDHEQLVFFGQAGGLALADASVGAADQRADRVVERGRGARLVVVGGERLDVADRFVVDDQLEGLLGVELGDGDAAVVVAAALLGEQLVGLADDGLAERAHGAGAVDQVPDFERLGSGFGGLGHCVFLLSLRPSGAAAGRPPYFVSDQH